MDIRNEVVKLRSNVIKVVVVVFMDELGVDKWNNIFLGNNFIVIIKFDKDKKEVKKLFYIVSKGMLFYV